MKTFLLGFIALLTLQSLQLKAQLSAEVIHCNSVYSMNSLPNFEGRITFAHVLERHISDNIWMSYDKKFDNEKESLFESLPQGKYRVKFVEKIKEKGGSLYKEIIAVSNSVDISSCDENKENKFPAIKISPNPSNGTTVVTLSQIFFDEKMTLKISALNGGVIKTWDVVNEVFSFTLDGIPAGVYFVELSSNGKRVAVEKLIVN